jgi:transglutaminase-like putative cysteine protease
VRRAVGLLLGAAGLAVVAGAVASLALFALAVGLLVVTAGAGASVLLVARGLAVTRWVPNNQACENHPISVHFEVRGLGRLPLVHLEAQADPGGWAPLGERGGTLELTIGRRGKYQLAPSRLRLRDALGIFERSLLAGQPEPLLVLPTPNLTVRIPPQLGAWSAADETDLDGLQPYTPGTPIGRIHWPALARGAGLQQRRLAAPPAGLPLVVVDTTGASDPRALDWAARAAAGTVVRLARSGGCQVLLPGDPTVTTVTDTAATWRGLHCRLALLVQAGTAAARLPMGAGQPPVVWIRAARAPAEVLGARPQPLPPGVVAVASPGVDTPMTGLAAAAASASGPNSLAVGTATALLVGAGACGWSWLLGGSMVLVAPLVAVAAVAVLLAAGRLSRCRAAGLLAVWVPAATLVAGVPAGRLLPQAWPLVVAWLAKGVGRLGAPGGGSPVDPSWPRAAWLLGAGAVWTAGAALAGSGPSSARWRAISFGVLAMPWIAAVMLATTGARQSDRVAWQGAAVLLAGLLWFSARRVTLRPALVAGLVAALVSVGITQAVGPRERWLTPGSLFGSAPPFQTLETERLTYGPLQGRRSGATMLEVSAAQPALWRMRVLDAFVEDTWGVRSWAAPELPQPAAEPTEIKVGVRGLRDDLVVAPGRIDAVQVHGTAIQASGEGWHLSPPPHRGDTYQIRASLVRVTAERLRGAPAPTDPRLRVYMDLSTRLTPGNEWRTVEVPLFGQPPDPQVTAALNRTPYGPVAALARQLAAGATTQWDVVAHVQRYLLDGDRLRYTTNLPRSGSFPLLDFLLRDHAGDCQHFAGAAALLLRLAGVPTRVVVGFATGLRQGEGRFKVRDTDAHTWIEVYFQGYGWVPFNPTPTAAQAEISRELGLLGPATTGGDRHAGGRLGWLSLGVILATAGVAVVRRRTRRRPAQLGPLLERLVRRTGGHAAPSSTLAELGSELARLVGPQTAALAAQAERARFAPDVSGPVAHPRIRVARAVVSDLGTVRALTLSASLSMSRSMLALPSATQHERVT